MNIRSITLGVNWEDCSKRELAKDINKFMKASRHVFSDKGFDVRTCRLSMPPISDYSQFSNASTR